MICVAVNDPYVMNAWAKSMGNIPPGVLRVHQMGRAPDIEHAATGDGAKGIQFYADMRRELTKYMVLASSHFLSRSLCIAILLRTEDGVPKNRFSLRACA